MDDQTPEVTDQDRVDSAHKLFGQGGDSALAAIDSVPAPSDQSDPTTRNVAGAESPDKWVIPQVDVASTDGPPPRPRGADFLDQIPDAATRQSGPDGAPAAPQPAFLSSIPDAVGPLQQAHAEASVFDAAHSAIVRRLAAQFGQPPEFIDKNIQQAKAQAETPAPSFFQAMEKNYPGSTKFYSQPENMAVAHDDMPNAVQTEGIIKSAAESRSLWNLFKTGLGESVAGDVFGANQHPNVPSDLSMSESVALQAGHLAPDLPVMAGGGLMGALALAETGPVGAIAGAGAGAMATPTAIHEILDAYRNGNIKTVGQGFSRFLEAEKKIGKQAVVGAGGALTAYFAGPFGAVPAMVAENAALTVGGKAVEGEIRNANDLMDYTSGNEFPREFGENMLLATGFHAATVGAHAIRGRIADAQQTRVDRQLYDNVGQAASDSKLRDRLPDVHRGFVQSLAEGTPYQNLFLPVDAATSYFQSKGMDIEDVARDLGVSDSLGEARSTGGDIQIPLATWLEKMVGTEHYKALRDDVKFSREDLSPRQSAGIESETRARVQDAADHALKEAGDVPADADQQARIDAGEKVYQSMQQKLTEAGLSGAEVKANPHLFSGFFSTLADRINEKAPDEQKVNAFDLQQRFNVDVNQYGTTAERDAARVFQGVRASQNQSFDQSPADRLARAKAMGFDTDTKYYHGSKSDITAFDPEKLGASTKAESAGKAFFFSDNPDIAGLFGYIAPTEARSEYDRLSKEYEDRFRAGEKESSKKMKALLKRVNEFSDKADLQPGRGKLTDEENRVYPTHLKTENPFRMDMGGREFEPGELSELLEKAKAAGHDSAIFDNAIDSPHQKERTPSRIAAVFDPSQIRSVHAEFDPTKAKSPNILDQKAAKPIESELQTSHPIPDSVPSPEIKPDESLAGLSKEELRSRALEFAQGEAERGSVKNEHTEREISVSSDGLKKSANYATRPEQALGIENVKTLIENATYLRSEPDRGGDKNVQHNYLYSPFSSDGKEYVAKIDVKETLAGRYKGKQTLYSLHVMEMKKPAEAPAIVPEAAGEPAGTSTDYTSEGSQGSSSGTVSKAELFRRVNEARETSPLFQGDENNPRGQISFSGRNFNIDLFKGKDVSTFLHESGHYFLEVLGHVVEGEGEGSEGLQKDYASILKYLGVTSRDEIGTEQHEKFARAFEQYLSEGKAPSAGLQSAFTQFRRWLTDLWRKVSFQGAEVSPEIRGVFDRMLATEDQINEARQSVDLNKEFSLDGLDEKTKSEIQGLREKARSRAEETLLKERMKETTADYRENLAKERAKYQDAAEAEVREEPLFKAIDDLRDHVSGRDPYDAAESALRGELSPEESTEFQMLADEHGFTTAQEMAEKISEAGANNLFETKVNSLVDEALRNVGAIKDQATLREEALKAVHSEDSEQLMALEHATLLDLATKKILSAEQRAQNRAQAKLEVEAARGEAQMILGKMPASEAGRAQRFVTQERNAAARVARLVARKEFGKAAEAKQQQLVAHALVSESFRISEEATKHTNYIEKFMNRRGKLLDMPYGFVRQLDVLLDRFGFQTMPKEDVAVHQAIATGMAGEGATPAAIADATGLVQDSQGRWATETLAQFQERRNEGYHAFQFPPEVLGAIRRDSKDLTIDDLRMLRETMQAIAEGGRKNDRFLNEHHRVDVKQAAATFRAKVEKSFGKPYEEQLLPGKTDQGKLADLLDTLRHFPDALNRTLDTMLTTCHKFDGLEEGPAKEFIYRPMAEAEARKTTRTRQSMEEMEAIFAKHFQPGEFQGYKDTEIAQNGRKWTKENILAMALNWGNGGNRQRLHAMPGLDEAGVRQLFSHLGKRDWDFVQDTWDHIDKYWPEIKKLEMAVNGIEPGKVQAQAFKIGDTEYKGGYYPIAYDFEKSADAFQNQQSKDALFKQYSTARAATAQGHTEARVARVTRPLRLSMDVLANHHEDVIHDIEYRKAVIDLNRFLSERDTKTAITNAVGIRGYAAVQDWLKSIAGGNSEPLSAWDKAAQWFRFRSTFFNMGYKMQSAPKIALENVVNTSAELGWLDTAKAVGSFYKDSTVSALSEAQTSGVARAVKNYFLNETGAHEAVIEKSAFMRERGEHLDRDMGDLISRQKGQGASAFQKYAFFVHAYLDRGMSFPLWSASYREAMAGHGDERLAVHQADEAVKRTFMTGGAVDQAAAARGSESKKAFTVAYGYQSMMWNRFSRARFQASMEWNNGEHMQAAATMAMASVYSFLFPSIVAGVTGSLMRNGPPVSPADEKKRLLKTALEEGSPLKFVPIARNLNGYLIGRAMGEHQRDLQLSVLDSAFQNVLDPAGQALSGQHSKNFGEQSAHALSMAVGIPKQVNDIAFNFLDWQHGHGALTWRDALSRRQKK